MLELLVRHLPRSKATALRLLEYVYIHHQIGDG
jgi:hypothetical protein